MFKTCESHARDLADTGSREMCSPDVCTPVKFVRYLRRVRIQQSNFGGSTAGKGVSTCAAIGCDSSTRLSSYEANFAYEEGGQ